MSLVPVSDFDIGGVAAAIVAFIAWRAGTLTRPGAAAAWFVGTATYGGFGGRGAAVLLAFFVTSVGLSRYGRARKRAALADVAKTGARDAAQVFANGAVAAACALAAFFVDHRFAAAFAGAFAAATADTWGTEIGSLAGARPRSIVTGAEIATGLSGGITPAGTLAEIAGALLIAGISAACAIAPFTAVAAAGVAGAFADSLLGGSVQALRYCRQCATFCESEPHRCGANTELARGLAWFNNDAVNFAATLTGAALGFLLAP